MIAIPKRALSSDQYAEEYEEENYEDGHITYGEHMSMDKDEMDRRLRRASEQREKIAEYLLEKPKTKITSVLHINREKEEMLKRYYLRDTQPKTERENVFDVYDYHAEQYRSKEFKVLPHLQPCNLKAFGTGENLVFPIYSVSKSRSIKYPDTNYFEPVDETYKGENSYPYQGGSSGNQYREFSTTSSSEEKLSSKKKIPLPECSFEEISKRYIPLGKTVLNQINSIKEEFSTKKKLLPERTSEDINRHFIPLRKTASDVEGKINEQTPKVKTDVDWKALWKSINPPQIPSKDTTNTIEEYLSTVNLSNEQQIPFEAPLKAENHTKSLQLLNPNQASNVKPQNRQTDDLELVRKCLKLLQASDLVRIPLSTDNEFKLVEKCLAALSAIKKQDEAKCKLEIKTECQRSCKIENRNISTQTDSSTWKITNVSFTNKNLANNNAKHSERLFKDLQTTFVCKVNHEDPRKTKSLSAIIVNENQNVETKKIISGFPLRVQNKNENGLLNCQHKTKNLQKKNYHTVKRFRAYLAHRSFNTSTPKRRKTDERSVAQAKLIESRVMCKKLSSVGTRDCPSMSLKVCKQRDKSAEEGCFRDYPFVKCHKIKPPYPSFSECGELYEIVPTCECLAECRILQPKYPIIEELKLLKPPTPESGGEHIDGLKKKECIRKKTGQVNEGITKTCCTFNDPKNEMQGMGRLQKEEREEDEENLE